MNRVFNGNHVAWWDIRDLPPFLDISLKWSQRKSKYCYMAASHCMGTFAYIHWGILEHFSFPPWSPGAATVWQPAHFPSCGLRSVRYILFICFCICEEWRYSLLLFVLLGEMAQQMVKRTNGPVVSETNNSLRGENILRLSAYSVFFIFPAHLSKDHLRVKRGFSGHWAVACWLLLMMI